MNKPKQDTNPKDRTETLGRSLVQHGKSNDRVYLMKLDGSDYPSIIEQMDTLAGKKGYTKIFAKVPARYSAAFLDARFTSEAHVPQFFNGREDAFFMAKYYNDNRARMPNENLIKDVIEHATQTQPLQGTAPLSDSYICRILTPTDTEMLAGLYGEVFETYPFPIHDPAFLKDAMAAETVFFGVYRDGVLAAASSCEMDVQSKNVEMTDFATHPDHRGQGLAAYLLYIMELEMQKRGIKTAYTIARSVSYGMNITFAKHRYTLAGTLINNTNISGSLESMNVWYKSLDIGSN